MVKTAKLLRRALDIARIDYSMGSYDSDAMAHVIAWLTARVRATAKPKPQYEQLPMFAVVGKPSGKYRCVACGHAFGENAVSRLQSKRAYLTLHCPHCLCSWYTDNSQ